MGERLLKTKILQPRGLYNNGNTCYFNAAIQSLHQTNVFAQNLRRLSALASTPFPAQNEDNNFSRIWSSFKSLFLGTQMKQKILIWIVFSVAVYKAGYNGFPISGLFWILKHLKTPMSHLWRDFIKINSSNASETTIIVEGGSSLALTFPQYLNSLRTCPKVHQFESPATLSTAEVVLSMEAFSLLIFGVLIRCFWNSNSAWKNYLIRQWYPVAKSLFSDKDQAIILCCLASLFYGAGRLMASSLDTSISLQHLIRNPSSILLFLIGSVPLVVLTFRCLAEAIHNGKPFLFSLSSKAPERASVSLAELFCEMDCKTERGSCNPRHVLEAVRLHAPRFRGFHQQDCHELMRHLLEGIREDEKQLKQKTKFLTIVDRVFGGHFRTVYTCLSCKTLHCLYEPFLDISLPIVLHEDTLKEIEDPRENKPDIVLLSSERNVEFWLKVYTRNEMLSGEYFCNSCNKEMIGDDYKLTDSMKQTLICDPPAILCIHLKRFKQNPSSQAFEKVNSHVTFSEFLDLTPFLSAECRRIDERQQNVHYSLYAVVVHSGTLQGGHYIAYVKSRADDGQENATNINTEKFIQKEDFDWDQLPSDRIINLDNHPPDFNGSESFGDSASDWYYCSDSTVTRVESSEVFSQQAYLLFYERIC